MEARPGSIRFQIANNLKPNTKLWQKNKTSGPFLWHQGYF